jgi:ATP-dependent Clp protease adaptor protein ClpS
MAGKPREETESDVVLEEDSEEKLKHPQQYAVILLNDDYTTMEFVIEVLMRFFRKTHEEALQIMLHVHQKGRGVAGIYSHEIAETKVFQVHELAKSRGFPMRCTMEPA